mmetsp:Transcript_3312/g.6873  ORF Transcript_3312/g.6873 Transcript_3312/m.6873 type:complete len:293 (-) Transcript_3312:1238-2116(-)
MYDVASSGPRMSPRSRFRALRATPTDTSASGCSSSARLQLERSTAVASEGASRMAHTVGAGGAPVIRSIRPGTSISSEVRMVESSWSRRPSDTHVLNDAAFHACATSALRLPLALPEALEPPSAFFAAVPREPFREPFREPAFDPVVPPFERVFLAVRGRWRPVLAAEPAPLALLRAILYCVRSRRRFLRVAAFSTSCCMTIAASVRTMLGWSVETAVSRGATPSSLAAEAFAPCDSKKFAIAGWRHTTAKCRGVSPLALRASRGAAGFLSTSSFATARWPFGSATCSGVEP